jgi:hypothetical protein
VCSTVGVRACILRCVVTSRVGRAQIDASVSVLCDVQNTLVNNVFGVSALPTACAVCFDACSLAPCSYAINSVL